MHFDFHAHLARQRAFSDKTFGPGRRTQGVCDHIRKELIEVERAPDDLGEWIDVVILALDGAGRTGATPEQIIAALIAKQTKNEARTWPDWRTQPADKAIEHDRSAEESAEAPLLTGHDNRQQVGFTMRACAGDDPDRTAVVLFPESLGVKLIAAERARQIDVEGFSPERDDSYMERELALAARSYVEFSALSPFLRDLVLAADNISETCWPWAPELFKPGRDNTDESRVRELVKAGALIAAEIDRLERLKGRP